MKHVLVVTESKSVWGAERSLLQLAKFANANGVALQFLIAPNSPLAANLEDMNLPYEYHEFAEHPALQASGSFSRAGLRAALGELPSVLAGAWRIRRRLAKFDSVLVFSIWQAPETILGAWMARVPVDIDLHETFSHAPAMRALGFIARASRRVVVPSSVLAKRSGLAASSRVVVVPRPVSFESHPSSRYSRRTTGGLTVGIFGQIQPHKNVLEIAELITTENRDIRLLVVGGDPNESTRSDYERRVRRSLAMTHTGSRVIDFVPDVTPLMRECDVIINASDHEAFGRTIVEAVAVGCYPISVGDWGPKETIDFLGVGSALDGIEQIPEVLNQLAAKRIDGPLLLAAPQTLAAYRAEDVAKTYFRVLSARGSANVQDN